MKLVVVGLALAICVVPCATPAAAQSPEGGQFDIMMMDGGAGWAAGTNIQFMSAPIAFDTQPVADAPYSAEAVTEVVQTLADGNKIVRQSKAQISRDSAGRTRREQGLAMLGPVVNDQDEFRQVQITDPQSQTTITLDLRSKTAHKLPLPSFKFIEGSAIAGQATATARTFTMTRPAISSGTPAAGGAQVVYRAERKTTMPAGEGTTEKLGTQVIEGVPAEGIRTTYTIAAGVIGNQLPIIVSSERWMSPDLKVLVMSRQSDPRYGETTYRLTNINRSEPAPELFQIPADFTLVEPAMQRDITIERKLP